MKNRNNTITVHPNALIKQSGLFLMIILLAGLFTTDSLQAQGSLLLTTKRVVFEGKKNSEIINLANLGKDTAQYVISLVEYRMKEDGGFEEITQKEAGQFSAAPFIRFFPRIVTLAPHEAQVIRLQLDKKGGTLAAGEYRSHLYVRAVPKITALGEADSVQMDGIGVKLVPVPPFNNTDVVLPMTFATARSGMPSPFISPIATLSGPAPVAKSVLVKLATPVPVAALSNTDTVLSP